jgi:KDO2-lipid IV(A) lauroyltransferase
MKKQTRWRLELWLYNTIEFLISLLPRKACLAIGRGLGSLLYFFDKKHRRTAQKNLDTAFGGIKSPKERKQIAKQSFKHFGSFVTDIIKLQRYSPEKIKKLITFIGQEHFEKAKKQGNGILIFTAHFGNWEVGSLLISKLGKLNVIARRSDNRLLEEKLISIRRNFGVHVTYKQLAAKKILQALGNNEIVAILIDQNVLRSEAVFVDFFGKKAATTPSIATFHIRTQAPLVPMFCYPEYGGKYTVRAFPPPSPSLSGNRKQDIIDLTQACTQIIESQIRKNPGLWLWFHDRWKSRP